MFKFQADLSKLLNRYINKEHKYGQNDCNILVAEYIDMTCGTDYASKLISKYDSVQSGLKHCKELTGFNNVLEACEKHFEKSNIIETGSIVLIKKHTDAEFITLRRLSLTTKQLLNTTTNTL